MTFPFPFFVPSAAGSYPTVQATNSGNVANNATHACPLPTGLANGDLLIIFASFAANNAFSMNIPGGYNFLYTTIGPSSLRRAAGIYRFCDGTEGSTVNLTSSGGTPNWASNSYRITGYTGTPEAGTTATGTSTAPNPPNLVPSWGALKTLYLVACHASFNGVPSGYPSGYTDSVSSNTTGSPQGSTASARQPLQVASEDPGAFTITSAPWASNVVAIRGL